MKCCWCQRKITNSPFVEKKWQGIEETELYHTHYFIVAHKGLLDNIPNTVPQPPLILPEEDDWYAEKTARNAQGLK